MRTRPLALAGPLFAALLFLLPVPSGGIWNRRYLANLTAPTRAAWLGARDGAPHFLPADPAAGAGVGAYAGTYVPVSGLAEAGAALSRLGAPWVRTEVPWAGVEPLPGQWRWEPWDRAVDLLHAGGHRLVGMLAYWTEGAQDYSDHALARFETYAEKVARRYRGKIDVWEVWNEPNEWTYWRSTPERYVDLLRAASRGARRGNPQARILGGSTSGADLHFLRRIFVAGAAEWMDAVSLHPYSFGWIPESTHLVDELRGVSRLAFEAGVSPELWVTEVGAPGADDPKYADLLERHAVLLAQSGVTAAWFWHCLYYAEPLDYALHRPNWTPREGARRFRTYLERVRGLRPAGPALPPDHTAPWGAGTPFSDTPTQSWLFRGARRTLRASWVGGGNVSATALSAGGRPAELGRRAAWQELSPSGRYPQ